MAEYKRSSISAASFWSSIEILLIEIKLMSQVVAMDAIE